MTRAALRALTTVLLWLPACQGPPDSPAPHDGLRERLEQLNSDDWRQVKAAAEGLPRDGDSSAAIADALVGVLRRGPPAVLDEMPNAVTLDDVAPISAGGLDQGRLQAEACVAVARGLVRVGPPALPALTAVLRDGSLPEGTRGFAVWAAGELGPPAIPLLILALGDSYAGARVLAASALGRLGGSARDAIPALEKAAADPSPFVRKHAAEALGKIRG